jgi:protein-tyrosine kinase
LTRLTDALQRADKDHVATTDQIEIAPAWTDAADPIVPASRVNLFDHTAEEPVDDEDADGAVPVDFEYHLADEARTKMVVGPDADHTVVEQFRHLAAALHHAQLKHSVRTVMVSSAVEAEGKTTTAANIALTLSHSHQRRVLLIDGDLRRPSLHTLFQENNRDGLGDYLRGFGRSRTRPAIHALSPNLSLLTAGRPTSDPMGALVSPEMKEVIDDAAEHFDWVVVDTPPVALLSDANLLASMIDVAILVVRASSTAFPLVQRARQAIGPERILGVVLNRAKRSDLAAGYGYYYYGYSYRAAEPEPRRGLARWFGRK